MSGRQRARGDDVVATWRRALGALGGGPAHDARGGEGDHTGCVGHVGLVDAGAGYRRARCPTPDLLYPLKNILNEFP